MKQRIRVVGIVMREGEVLFLKRRRGRGDFVSKWELPTGKIEFGEQPEEAIARTLYQFLGIKVDKIELKDVITFLSPEGSSQLNNLYIVYNVGIAPKERIDLKDRWTAYKFVKNPENGIADLDQASLAVMSIEMTEQKTYKDTVYGATVYVDGASRGNPGPAGIGYYIVGEDGKELKRGGEFVGFATSRVAEYYAMKEGIEQAIELGLKNVRFVGDNLMIINQLKGIYKLKNADLNEIYVDIQNLLENFEACAFVHVHRENNTIADKEANLAIDRYFKM